MTGASEGIGRAYATEVSGGMCVSNFENVRIEF